MYLLANCNNEVFQSSATSFHLAVWITFDYASEESACTT